LRSFQITDTQLLKVRLATFHAGIAVIEGRRIEERATTVTANLYLSQAKSIDRMAFTAAGI
jgi:hypothetical protein